MELGDSIATNAYRKVRSVLEEVVSQKVIALTEYPTRNSLGDLVEDFIEQLVVRSVWVTVWRVENIITWKTEWN